MPVSFNQRRRALIEQLGGSWRLKIKDDCRIIETGKCFWLTNGKKVGIVKVLQVFEQWQTAQLEAVLLTGDEIEFGFGYSFWDDPDTYLSGRSFLEVSSFELWGDKPSPSAKAQKGQDSSGSWLKLAIWEWFRTQNWKQSDREEMQVALNTNDQLLLGNTYWFAQKQVGELSQRNGQLLDMQEFDFWFWKLLHNVVTTVGDIPSTPSQRTLKEVNLAIIGKNKAVMALP